MPEIAANLGLDKTAFIYRFKPGKNNTGLMPEFADTYTAVRQHIAYCTNAYKKGATTWKFKKGPQSASSLPLDGDPDASLYIMAGWSSKAGCHYFVVEFNPAHLTLAGSTELLAVFGGLFNHGFEEFLQHAAVQYLETPLDVVGAHFADYLFVDTAVKTCDAELEPDGTMYLGSKKSPKYWCIYDKAKELREQKGIQLLFPLLRVEPCLQPNVAFDELPALRNPFSSLHIIDRSRLAQRADNVLLNRLRRRVDQEGMTAQQAYASSADRKNLAISLRSTWPSWYKPATFWLSFPTVAQRLTVAGLQSVPA